MRRIPQVGPELEGIRKLDHLGGRANMGYLLSLVVVAQENSQTAFVVWENSVVVIVKIWSFRPFVDRASERDDGDDVVLIICRGSECLGGLLLAVEFY